MPMPSPLPKGYSPPAYSVNEEDHGGLAVVASGIAVVVTALVLLVRLPMRPTVTIRMSSDECTILISTVRKVASYAAGLVG